MMTRTVTRTYANCPHCGQKAGQVDHITGTEAGEWSCDACGGWYLVRKVKGKVVVTKGTRQKWNEYWVFLRCDKLTVLIKHRTPTREPGDDQTEVEHLSYYLAEHTCPTNWMYAIEEMAYDGIQDNHDTFTVVKAILTQPGDDADDIMRRYININQEPQPRIDAPPAGAPDAPPAKPPPPKRARRFTVRCPSCGHTKSGTSTCVGVPGGDALDTFLANTHDCPKCRQRARGPAWVVP